MEEQSSKFWNVALVFSVLLLAGIAYLKFDPVRTAVDAKCPWVKEQLGKCCAKSPWLNEQLSKQGIQLASQTASASTVAATSLESSASKTRQSWWAPSPSQEKKGALNLTQIAADQSVWPKKVRLMKDTAFPAVMNKKQVGKINVPAGTEVRLYQVTVDKLAVTYSPNGAAESTGGTFVPPNDTDLVERVNAGSH